MKQKGMKEEKELMIAGGRNRKKVQKGRGKSRLKRKRRHKGAREMENRENARKGDRGERIMTDRVRNK